MVWEHPLTFGLCASTTGKDRNSRVATSLPITCCMSARLVIGTWSGVFVSISANLKPLMVSDHARR